MVNIAVAIILVVIWLLILGIATTHLLVVISSQTLLLVFIFGNACKTVFEALVFLFATYPFDVGDRCEVDGVQVNREKTRALAPTNPTVVVKDVEDMNKLKIEVWLKHRMNYQDMHERWVRKASLVEEMVKVLRELDIEYRLPPLNINVRNMPELSSTRLPSTWGTFA
ncbi:hypothetical protein AAC387_Pa07g1053 [Persea americana]